MSASSPGSQLLKGQAWDSSLVDPGTGVLKEVEGWLEMTTYFHSRKHGSPSEKFPKQGPGNMLWERSSGWVTWAIILTNSSFTFSLRKPGKDVLILQEQSPSTNVQCPVTLNESQGEDYRGGVKRETWAGLRVQNSSGGREEGRALPEASSRIWNGLSLQSRHAVISRALACLGAITACFLQGAL